jgi:predicted transcriptional regulator
MSDYIYSDKNPKLHLYNEADSEYIQKIAYALSSMERIKIMNSLAHSNKSMSMLSNEFDIPQTTLARHMNILLDAGLVVVNYQPGIKGHAKFYASAIRSVMLDLYSTPRTSQNKSYSVEMPVGMYAHCHITPPCGLLGKTQKLIEYDNPKLFFTPNRNEAELLWFNTGYITYNFPTECLYHHKCSSVSFSFEVCSETEFYNTNWPSDLTISVNNVELFTTTMPGDFGGRRGIFSPTYWSIQSTQYGLLKNVEINEIGVFENNKLIRDDINFNTLKLYDGNTISLKLEIKPDAVYRGGINLFGKNFGDFNQAIVMTVK